MANHLDQLQEQDIAELGLAIRKLGEGDTSYPLEPNISRHVLFEEARKNDELGFIARSLNKLAAQTESAMGSFINAQAEVEAASHRVQKSEQRFRSMIEGLGEGLVIIDLEGNIQFANRKFLTMLSVSEGEISGRPLDETLGAGVWIQHTHSHQSGEFVPSRSIEAEVTTARARFHAEFMLSPLEGYDGGVDGCICAMLDITERKMFEDQLRHQALHDALTGLPNRALFTDRVSQAIVRHEYGKLKFAIIFIDLDNFKVVNDSLGHAAGDVLLNVVAQRLQQCVRGGDTVARLGGDEFTILLERLSSEDEVQMVLGRIQKFFSSPIKIGDQEVAIGGSLGVAYSSDVSNDAGELLRFADIAMYQAKALGKHRHVVFDESMRKLAEDRLELERELRIALEEGLLDVYFQPIVDSVNSNLLEVEALCRWNSAERGMIPPTRFIPIAEESGLINELGAYVLRRACQFGAKCLANGTEIVVGVNLSASQLLDPNIVSFVASVLGDTGLPSRCLKLEITESMIMEDPTQGIEKLRHLKVLGIKLAMDDFGTGYSSMAQLKQMPIDTLKIDREFVKRLNDSSEDQAIVLAIINMAQALQLSVTCEGIESRDQANILGSMGCQRLQGFFFDRPMTEQELWKSYFADSSSEAA
jgi:diguanylate cyclase (GGDEF)-like protein/PAS domain S-box-containing protein